jgi:hypothetical protein
MRALVAALLLFASLASAAEIKIVGPDSLKPGEYAKYAIEGLGPDMIPSARLIHFPRGSSVLVIDGQSWRGEAYALVAIRQRGEYLLAVVVNDKAGEQAIYAEKVIVVGGGPGPQPDPDPQPDPKPIGKYSVVIVEERGDRYKLPASQIAVLASSLLRGQVEALGHRLIGIIDKDAKAKGGVVPPAIEPFLTAATGKPLPCVVMRDEAGKITTAPLPANADAFFRLLGPPKRR